MAFIEEMAESTRVAELVCKVVNDLFSYVNIFKLWSDWWLIGKSYKSINYIDKVKLYFSDYQVIL